MTEHCVLWTDIKCPTCNSSLKDLDQQVWFQWGKVPETYKMNEAVCWITDKTGKQIPPFQRRKKRWYHLFGEVPWNAGESKFKDLWVFDTQLAPLPADFNSLYSCERCQSKYEAIGILIQNGILASVKVFLQGETESLFGSHITEPYDIVIICEDSTYWPRPDWYNPVVISPS